MKTQKKISDNRKKLRYLEKKVATLTEKLLVAFEELNIFYDITQSLSNIYDIKEICDIALEQVAEIVCSEKASIAILDKEDQEHLTLISCRGFSDNPIGQKVKIKGSLYNEVIKNRKPIIENEQGKYLSGTQKNKNYKTKFFVLHPLCTMPLSINDEVIGVISMSDKANKQAFTARDIKFLSAIATQTAIVIQNARLINNLRESFLTTVRSLSAAIDAKDPYTHGHSERVSKYALNIGRTLGISRADLQQLELTCLLHDVGKIGIPESILNKKNKLTSKEMEIIRLHTLKGVDILKRSGQAETIIAAVRHHHERYDGMGYPDGLIGEQIPLFARIIAVADSYDAMTSSRPYRSKCSQKVAVKEIRKGIGSQYDSKVVWAFLKWINRKRKRVKDIRTQTYNNQDYNERSTAE
jgi:putative nucleotidyltransferase with HDIG domain